MEEVGTPVQGLQLAHLFVGPFPAEHERARGAGPHDRVRVVLLDQGLGPLGEPAGRSEVEQRVDPVRILAHRGVNDGQAQVVAQPLLELGKVVLGAETGVEQPDGGHAAPPHIDGLSTIVVHAGAGARRVEGGRAPDEPGQSLTVSPLGRWVSCSAPRSVTRTGSEVS